MTPYIEDILELAEVKLANHGTRLMKLEDRIGFAEAWHDDHEKRLEIINKQITELSQAAPKAQCNGHEYLSDCIDKLAKKIGTLQLAARIGPRGTEAVDPHCVLQGQIDTLRKRVEEVMSKVANLETSAVCDPIILDEIFKQIGTLQTAQIQTSTRLDRHRLEVRNDVAASRPHQAGKRGFKGGWLNLYYTSPGKTVRAGALFATRVEADAAADGSDLRIACIHITDFAEGEGL